MTKVAIALKDRISQDSAQRTFDALSFDIILLASNRRLEVEDFDGSGADIAVIDHNLVRGDPLKFIVSMRENYPKLFLVLLSEESSVSNCAACMFAGADYFFPLPISPERLRTIPQLYETKARTEQLSLTSEALDLSHSKKQRGDFQAFVGRSAPMKKLYSLIERAAPTDAHIFITGESGVGKELAAQAVHNLSKRTGAFLAINCAAIPKDLLESELFGRIKGAFTGAVEASGAVELAKGGTLFLDELGEMDPLLQSKLLRFVQSGVYHAVGDASPRMADVRLVAATNKDPIKAIRDGQLREDLYFRLSLISMELPPLRKRGKDLDLLIDHFVVDFSREFGREKQILDSELRQHLKGYNWPGNVRQLEHVLKNILILNDDEVLTKEMSPDLPRLAGKFAQDMSYIETFNDFNAGPGLKPLWQVERDAIEQAIQLCDGQVQRAAQLLQIHPTTIYRKREQWQRMAASPLSFREVDEKDRQMTH